jgi:hypothetical protein
MKGHNVALPGKEPDNIDLRRIRAMAEDDRAAYGDGSRRQS